MAGKRVQELLIALAAAVVVAGAIGGLALLLGDSDDTPPPASPPPIALPEPGDTEPPQPTTPPGAPTVPQPVEVAPDGGEPGLEPGDGEALPSMGIPTAAFDWEASVLPLGDAEGWVHQLLTVDGELWAVVAAPEGEGEHTLLYTSGDGLRWEERALPAALGADGPAQLWATDDAVVAVVARWDELAERTDVWVLPNGGAWQQADLSAVIRDGHHFWLSDVAGGDGALVAVGASESMRTDQFPAVAVIERDGLVLEIDEAARSYLITDAASGEVVGHGDLDRLWQPEDPGACVIYDPSTRESLFRTRWEALDEAAIDAYENAIVGERLVVEVAEEDLALRLDQFTGILTVMDAAGNEVFAGREEDLWRGLPPTFTDPRTGEVILVVTWDEWEAAFEVVYASEEGFGSTPLLLRSTDGGLTWDAIDAAPDPVDGYFYFNGVARGPDGFLALGAIESGIDAEAQPPQPVILHSPDGLAWTELPGEGLPGWLYQLSWEGDRSHALLHDEEGAGVVASDDGLTWRMLLRDDDLALPVGSAWFDHVAHGPLGTFVAGTWDGWVEPEGGVVIAEQGRTLTIAGGIYTVTDDATGEVLFTFDERQAWDGEGQVADSGFRWSQGGLAVFADDGTVAFAVSHRELEEAMRGQHAEPEARYRSEQFVVWSDGTGWQRVALPDDLGPHAWCAGMVALDDRVVLATHVDTFHGEGEVDTELRILVGRPDERP